jgi:iron complex outermembrane receptor protein
MTLVAGKIAIAAAVLCLPGVILAAADNDEPLGLDEVVVTATRRETRLLDTPISMTVIGADTLQAIDADGFDDFSRLVPGLTAIDSGPGDKRYSLRGLQSAGEPEVGLYYDDIPITGLPGGSLDTGDRQPDIKLWDVDRIEVLRGPQGTLYGDGSMGGTLRIISKRPMLDSFQAATQVAGATTADGGGPSWRWSGMVNLPVITDTLAVRLAGYYRDAGGWIDEFDRPQVTVRQTPGSGLNWEHTAGGRASILFKPTDDLTVTGIAYYQMLTTGNAFDTYPDFAVPADRYISAAFVRTPWTDQLQMYNLVVNDNLKWADLVVSGSYESRTVDDTQDTTRYLLSLFGCSEYNFNVSCFGPPIIPAASFEHESVSALSGEVRLVSRQEGPLQWTVGSFIQSATTYRRGQIASTDPSGYVQFEPSNGNATSRLFARTNYDAFDKLALFEESSYELRQGLDAIVGLRWFHSYRSDEQVIVQQFFPSEPTGPEPFQKFSENALFKKFELSYKLTPAALLYAGASQGFRSGGPNYPGGFTATAPPYRGDSLWDYEIGWKVALAGQRIDWTGALFRINWSNLQQLVPTTLFNYIVNAGSARSDGFETEISAPLYRGLRLEAGASLANAHLIGAQPVSNDPGTQLYEGERLAGTSRWTVNAGLTYARPLTAQLRATARLDYTYHSGSADLVAVQNPAYFVIPGSNLVALHLGVDHNDSWSIQLAVDNLCNSYVPLSAKTLDSNLVESITAARPRTLSLSFTERVRPTP